MASQARRKHSTHSGHSIFTPAAKYCASNFSEVSMLIMRPKRRVFANVPVVGIANPALAGWVLVGAAPNTRKTRFPGQTVKLSIFGFVSPCCFHSLKRFGIQTFSGIKQSIECLHQCRTFAAVIRPIGRCYASGVGFGKHRPAGPNRLRAGGSQQVQKFRRKNSANKGIFPNQKVLYIFSAEGVRIPGTHIPRRPRRPKLSLPFSCPPPAAPSSARATHNAKYGACTLPKSEL